MADDKHEIKESIKIKGIKVSPSGKYIAVDSAETLYIYELINNSLEKINEKVFSTIIKDLSYNDQNLLAVTLRDGSIILWQHEVHRNPITFTLEKIDMLKFNDIYEIYFSVPSNYSL